jgi:hypothetical protein
MATPVCLTYAGTFRNPGARDDFARCGCTLRPWATGAFVTFSVGPLLNTPLAKADGLDAIVDPIINALACVDPMLAVDVTSWLANADAALSAASTFDPPNLDSTMAAAGVERSACRPRMINYRFALFVRVGTVAAPAAVELRMPGMTKLRSVARLSMRLSCRPPAR